MRCGASPSFSASASDVKAFKNLKSLRGPLPLSGGCALTCSYKGCPSFQALKRMVVDICFTSLPVSTSLDKSKSPATQRCAASSCTTTLSQRASVFCACDGAIAPAKTTATDKDLMIKTTALPLLESGLNPKILSISSSMQPQMPNQTSATFSSACVRNSRTSLYCSGQPIPDTTLSFSSATAGASPWLN